MKTHRKVKGLPTAKRPLTVQTVEMPSAPPRANARRVQQIRKGLEMSQAVFAATLNVSVKLVQGWEQGLRTCGRGELRLLELMTRHPKIFQDLTKAAGPRR